VSRDDRARVWSAGAQPERTALAWSRTALACTALLGLLVRQLLPDHPVAAIGLAATAVPVVVAVALAARARYRAGHHALHRGGALPDGRLAAGCVLLTTLVAVAAAVFIATG